MVSSIALLIQRRELIREMAIRDAKALNKGTALGGGWLVLRPLIQAGAYVAIVSFIFHSRLTPDSKTFDYALYVLCGMVPWQLLVHVVAVAPSLLNYHAAVVKQVVYPIETLPLRSMLVGWLASAVTLAVYLSLAAYSGSLQWTILLLPLPVLLLTAMLVGSAWILMLIGAILSDLREVVGAALNIVVFFTPVLISQNMVRAEVWIWFRWNPLSHVIICFRDVFEAQFHVESWMVFITLTAVLLSLGSWMISRWRLWVVDHL